MLYSPTEINTLINNVIVSEGLNTAKINGVPLGVISDDIDLERFGSRLLSQAHIANPFITAFYQQFIYRATAQNYFTSPFDYFREKRDGVAYGTYEADVQPIFPLKYDMKAFDRVLQFWETPVIAQYFAITRQDTIPQTITKNQLRQAFSSYEAFDSFLTKLIIAPRQGNVIVETNAIKMMLNTNLANGVIKRTNFTEPVTEAGWKELAAEIVGVANGMVAEPTTDYNNYVNIEGSNGVEAWAQSDRRDLVLIGDSKILAKLKTFVLAMSFNREDVDFNFHFIELNTFDYSTYDYADRTFKNKVKSPFKLLLCDGGYIKLEDNLDEEYSDPNIMTMGLQRALQIQQTIGLRVSRNALAWVEVEEGDVEKLALLNNAVQYTNELSTVTDDEIDYTTGEPVEYKFNRILTDEEGAALVENIRIQKLGDDTGAIVLDGSTEAGATAISALYQANIIGINISDTASNPVVKFARGASIDNTASGYTNVDETYIMVATIKITDDISVVWVSPAIFPTE